MALKGQKMNIAVIGGGASGMIAAITARRLGADVTVFEHMPRMGKKLLLTGSGKCNLSNTDMDISHFHGGDIKVISSVLTKCPPEETRQFFEGLGIFFKDRGGYLYPYSEQASSVVDVLRFTVRDLDIEVYTDVDIRMIDKNDAGFVILTGDSRFTADAVILCCGSSANRNTGSDGSGYALSKKLGHNVIKPLPALTYLLGDESFYPSIAGIRTKAGISLYARKDYKTDYELLASETGELQLTKSGISGIPVFNLSHHAVKALDEGKNVKAVIDFLPDVEKSQMNDFLKRRIEAMPKRCADEMFIGLFAKPLGICICKRCRIDLKAECASLDEKDINELSRMIKGFETVITGSGDFESSQTVQGGVDLAEIKENLESAIVPGLFFAGELLDVHGDCGGYNLQWAQSSGMAAAKGAYDTH